MEPLLQVQAGSAAAGLNAWSSGRRAERWLPLLLADLPVPEGQVDQAGPLVLADLPFRVSLAGRLDRPRREGPVVPRVQPHPAILAALADQAHLARLSVQVVPAVRQTRERRLPQLDLPILPRQQHLARQAAPPVRQGLPVRSDRENPAGRRVL